MASEDGLVSGDGVPNLIDAQSYYCHLCNRAVSARFSDASQELECSRCAGSFVEKYEDGVNDDLFVIEEMANEDSVDGSVAAVAGGNAGNILSDLVQRVLRNMASQNGMANVLLHVMAVQNGSGIMAGSDGAVQTGGPLATLAVLSSGNNTAWGLCIGP